MSKWGNNENGNSDWTNATGRGEINPAFVECYAIQERAAPAVALGVTDPGREPPVDVRFSGVCQVRRSS